MKAQLSKMWSRSPHTTTLVALVSLIGFSLIGSHTRSATVTPADPSPKQLIQAWVFDGAYEPSDVFGVALTDLGMLAHIENAFACPGGVSGTTTGFVSLSAAHEGIFTITPALPLGFGSDLDPTILLHLRRIRSIPTSLRMIVSRCSTKPLSQAI